MSFVDILDENIKVPHSYYLSLLNIARLATERSELKDNLYHKEKELGEALHSLHPAAVVRDRSNDFNKKER